jgi:hypothetical protein
MDPPIAMTECTDSIMTAANDPTAVTALDSKTDPIESSHAPSEKDVSSFDWVTVGQWVMVASRTSPGMNQPGGVGRITAVSDNGRCVAVRYVLDGRHEKQVEVDPFVRLHTIHGQRRLRDRSILLGRCRRCGSLRKDCGSCDYYNQDHEHHQQQQPVNSEHNREKEITTTSPLIKDDKHAESSSSSDESLKQIQKQVNAQYRRYRRLKAKRSILKDYGSSSSSSSSAKDAGTATPKRNSKPVQDSLVHLFDAGDQHPTPRKSFKSRKQQRRKKRLARMLYPIPIHAITRSKQRQQPHIPASRRPSTDNRSSTDSSQEESHPDINMDFLTMDLDDSENDSQVSLPSARLPSRSSVLHSSSSSSLQKDLNDADDDNIIDTSSATEFVQPDSQQLPEDVVDRTTHFKYEELTLLLDQTMDRLEYEQLGKARNQVVDFERQWNNVSPSDMMTMLELLEVT